MSGSGGQSGGVVERVRRFAAARGLLPPGCIVVVGVSGGADSVALLAVLAELSADPAAGYTLTAAHLDHSLRAESAEEARFVAALAERLGVPCVSDRLDVAAAARRRGVGVEEAARDARYEFLLAAARQAGGARVAVGHHADDNAETILFRVLRGTHLRGLRGIPAARELGEGVRLVRPLLCLDRETIRAFCRERGLGWQEDPTNADGRFARGFVRGELLPLLRERLNPRVEEALLRLADTAGEAEEFLAAEAGELLDEALVRSGEGELVLDARKLAAARAPLGRYVFRLALERIGAPLGEVTAGHFAAAEEVVADGGAVELPGGTEIRRRRGHVLVRSRRQDDPDRGAS